MLALISLLILTSFLKSSCTKIETAASFPSSRSQDPSIEGAILKCPFPYVKVGDICLHAICDASNPMNWQQARSFCQTMVGGGDLAALKDGCQFADAITYVRSFQTTQSCNYWVGGSDAAEEGIWRWLDGDFMKLGSPYWGQNIRGTGLAPETNANDLDHAYLNKYDNFLLKDGISGGVVESGPLCQITPKYITYPTPRPPNYPYPYGPPYPYPPYHYDKEKPWYKPPHSHYGTEKPWYKPPTSSYGVPTSGYGVPSYTERDENQSKPTSQTQSGSVRQEFHSNSPVRHDFQSNSPVRQDFQSNPLVRQDFQSSSPVRQDFQSNSPVRQDFQSNSFVRQDFQSNSPVRQDFHSIPVRQDIHSNFRRPDFHSSAVRQDFHSIPLRPESQLNPTRQEFHSDSSKLEFQNNPTRQSFPNSIKQEFHSNPVRQDLHSIPLRQDLLPLGHGIHSPVRQEFHHSGSSDFHSTPISSKNQEADIPKDDENQAVSERASDTNEELVPENQPHSAEPNAFEGTDQGHHGNVGGHDKLYRKEQVKLQPDSAKKNSGSTGAKENERQQTEQGKNQTHSEQEKQPEQTQEKEQTEYKDHREQEENDKNNQNQNQVHEQKDKIDQTERIQSRSEQNQENSEQEQKSNKRLFRNTRLGSSSPFQNQKKHISDKERVIFDAVLPKMMAELSKALHIFKA